MTRARRAIRTHHLILTFVAGLLAGPPPVQGQGFDGPYPSRIVTIESAAVHAAGDGLVGLGDTRIGIVDGRLEILTHTIPDVVGILNAGVKLGLVDAGGRRPAVAVGARYYHSVGGLIDAGVRRIAESFADVTDSEVDLRGWVAHATASWPLADGRSHLHASVQAHQPLESRFEVADSIAGGGGSVTFESGGDLSTMAGFDHRLIDTRLLLLLEAGYSWGLDEPRFGLALDGGSTDWRFVLGFIVPGVESDVASEPRDFHVTPVLSLHRRF